MKYAHCPQCEHKLISLKNNKYGHYYCEECPSNNRGDSDDAYFWDYEVVFVYVPVTVGMCPAGALRLREGLADAERNARTIYDIAHAREASQSATREDVEFKALALKNFSFVNDLARVLEEGE